MNRSFRIFRTMAATGLALTFALVPPMALAQTDTSTTGTSTAVTNTTTGTGTVAAANANCSTSVSAATSKAATDKINNINNIGTSIYKKPVSVTALSCISNLLSAAGNLFFVLPSLSSLLQQLVNALCVAAQNEFQSLTSPVTSAINNVLSGTQGITLPGGIYLNAGTQGSVSLGGGTSSLNVGSTGGTVNWGSSPGHLQITSPYVGDNPGSGGTSSIHGNNNNGSTDGILH